MYLGRNIKQENNLYYLVASLADNTRKLHRLYFNSYNEALNNMDVLIDRDNWTWFDAHIDPTI